MSGVWKHFKKEVGEAQCMMCPKKLKYTGGSTSGLIRHLQNIHKISLICSKESIVENNNNTDEKNCSAKTNPDTSSNSITNYMAKKTLPEILSRLAAVDGISIRCICKSTFIRESFAQRKMNLPKYETDIKNIILKFYNEVKDTMINKISSQVQKNERFSITLDEWTSVAQKRYLNICLTGVDTFYNLGLVFIPGRCTAIEIRKIVEIRLKEFNISLEKHIVATVSDGPNVMKRFVADSPIDGYFCWNHAIHLAVIQVLYSKNERPNSPSESEDSNDEDEYEKYEIIGKQTFIFVFQTCL